jgi:hypothetical protein
MFQRKRPHSGTMSEPRIAPPFMHDSDLGDDLEELLQHFELQRAAVPAGGPELVGLRSQIEACRGALAVVRVAELAIARAASRGRVYG